MAAKGSLNTLPPGVQNDAAEEPILFADRESTSTEVAEYREKPKMGATRKGVMAGFVTLELNRDFTSATRADGTHLLTWQLTLT